MVKRIEKLIKPSIIVGTIAFVVCCLIKRPSAKEDYFSYIGYSISVVTIAFIFYERYLWRFIPWNRPPVLKKKYAGRIKYQYKNQELSKDILVDVKQTWLTVCVKVNTDINSSSSITADIVSENNQDVLYYSYVTSPSALSEPKNPVQHGTCRMILNNANEVLDGKYWTTSKTTGDIHWSKT